MSVSHGKIVEIAPYDVMLPSLARLRRALPGARNSCFLVPTIPGAGWKVDLRNMRRCPVKLFSPAGLVRRPSSDRRL
ncbi:MAG TPA: hypothetical protein VNA27_12835 [Rubrobacteraceae bacterium]|nr:hypothetical protein [Rubrobacteraceae bacterium]